MSIRITDNPYDYIVPAHGVKSVMHPDWFGQISHTVECECVYWVSGLSLPRVTEAIRVHITQAEVPQ